MRRILPAFLILMLLSACASVESGYSFSREEAAAALYPLTEDMLARASEGRVPEGTIAGALPPSYRAFSAYVPLYAAIASEYTKELADILTPLIPEAFPAVRAAAEDAIASGPEKDIGGDTAFTDDLQARCAAEAGRIYLDAVESSSESLAEAFSASHSAFSDVRLAYLNLASVGYPVDIAEPEPVSDEVLAQVLVQELFTLLGNAERNVKNSPDSAADPAYAVFWRR